MEDKKNRYVFEFNGQKQIVLGTEIKRDYNSSIKIYDGVELVAIVSEPIFKLND